MKTSTKKLLSFLHCGNCTYWNPEEQANGYARCTRFPPQYVEFGAPSEHPRTSEEDFCAEFAEGEDADEVPIGQRYHQLEAVGVEVLKAWHGVHDEDSEYKLAPQMVKLQTVLEKLGVW